MNNVILEDANKAFAALDDSVTLINTDVDAAEHSTEVDNRVWRNWKHIEIMLDKDFIKNDGRDLTPYSNAIAKGLAFAPELAE